MANFKKDSGNSMKGVNQICVVRPGREATNENGKVTAKYVEIMADNSKLTKAEIAAGKGQASPNLYSKRTTYVDKNGETKQGYDNSIRITPSQLDAIEKAGEGKSLVKEDGTKYIPFKSDLMGLNESVKDKDGQAVMNENGKTKTKLVGYMPNTKTLEPSDYGKLTQARLDKHYNNTKAVHAQQAKMAAAEKSASLSATAEKADVQVEATAEAEASK